jgi:hypothetical protein
MAELWELICHHTYTGIPGVIVDQSPSGASHGKALGLSPSDFLTDGATPGSGAARFHAQNGRIYVPTQAAPWHVIGGIKGEVTVWREPAIQCFLLDGGSFQFYVRSDQLNGWFYGLPAQYAQINSAMDPVGSGQYLVPTNRWITLGFMHDGFGTMELSADGQVVARKSGIYNAVAPPGASELCIGNSWQGGAFANGQIDTVKIWRLNPRRIDEEFFSRPMDDATADCWKRFLDELREALRRHPDCAKRLSAAAQEAIDTLRRQAAAKGPETRVRIDATAREYNRLWRDGKLDSPEMVKVLAELMAWLRAVGLDPAKSPAVAAFANSECLRTMLCEVSPPDCDAQLVALLRALARVAGGGQDQAEAPRKGPR